MRTLIQRVSEASVTINGSVHGAIGRGLLLLVAFEEKDTKEDLQWTSGKVVRMRIFNDENGQMNRSLLDEQAQLLVISQFTLFASTRKGNRPSYMRSAAPATAIPLYEQFVRQLSRDQGGTVRTGQFGAHMNVHLVNDGPVTILLDSRHRE